MPKDLNDVTPSVAEGSTVYVAVEVSDKSWVVGIGAPSDPGKVGMHTLAPADTDGLVWKIEKACARVGDRCRVLLTYEAGYEGFWLARWLGLQAPQIDALVCDPASLEVVRKAKRAKTDRIDARRMVRALRAWDRGEEGSVCGSDPDGGGGGCQASSSQSGASGKGTHQAEQYDQGIAEAAGDPGSGAEAPVVSG